MRNLTLNPYCMAVSIVLKMTHSKTKTGIKKETKLIETFSFSII
jgi:hypothetical protein